MICPMNQTDWNAAKSLGYWSKSDFYFGRPKSTVEHLSWQGIGEQTFEASKNKVFVANFDSISIGSDSELTENRFLLPYGNCREVSPGNRKTLAVRSNDTNIQVFITDPAKTLYYKVSTLSMTGDELKLEINENAKFKKLLDFLVEIEQTAIDPTQEGQKCTNYGEGFQFHNFSHCLEMTLNRQVQQDIGCNIPWMSATNSCVGIIDKFFEPRTFDVLRSYTLNLLLNLEPENNVCLVPCLSTSINVKAISSDTSLQGENKIQIKFSPTVKLTESISGYDAWALTVEIGSALGLWLGLSAIGILDAVIVMIRNGSVISSSLLPK